MQQYAVTGQAAAPMPERLNAWAVYDVFELHAGEQMFIAATGDEQWKALCSIIGRSDLISHPDLASNNDRVRARPWMLPAVQETLRQLEGRGLAPQFEERNVPFASITRPEQLFDDAHLLQSGGLATLQVDDGTQTAMPLLPLSFNGERLQPRRAIPSIGEHTQEVMRNLGYSQAQIDELAAAGAFAAPPE